MSVAKVKMSLSENFKMSVICHFMSLVILLFKVHITREIKIRINIKKLIYYIIYIRMSGRPVTCAIK